MPPKKPEAKSDEKRNETVELFESLSNARIRLTIALELVRDANKAVMDAGLGASHVIEPLATCSALIDQSIARVYQLLGRVPL